MVDDTSDCLWRNHLISALSQAWREELHTDLRIVTQDGDIQAHKFILAAVSPYFRALLSVGLVEQQTETLTLSDISYDNMKVILQYIYSGEAKITSSNVTTILSYAEYFQIYSLKNLCCYYISANMTVSNSLHIYEVSHLHRCYDLADKALKNMVSNFEQLMDTKEFEKCSPATLMTLLDHENLSVPCHEQLLQSLVRWVEFNTEDRFEYLTCILKRFNLEFIEDVIQPESEIGSKIIQWKKNFSQGENLIDNTSYRREHKFSGGHEEEIIIVTGGEWTGRVSKEVECLTNSNPSWSYSLPSNTRRRPPSINDIDNNDLVVPAMSNPRVFAASASYNDKLYILGGQVNSTFLQSCEMYDASNNIWRNICSLPREMHGSGATFLDGTLYCVGGRTYGEISDEILAYSPTEDKWSTVARLLTPRTHVGVVNLHRCVYIIGGAITNKDGTSEIVGTCEKYDPETNTISSIAPMSVSRAYHGVVASNDHIFALGGYDGVTWINKVERYNPITDQWTKVASMMSCRSSFGVTLMNDRIYSIGGFDGTFMTNTVEKYNPRTDMWHTIAPMKLQKYGHIASTLNIKVS